MDTHEFKDIMDEIASGCLGVRVRLLSRVITTIYNDALRSHGIRSTQFNILVGVTAQGPVTSHELCSVLHLDSSSFSRAASRMKEKGWLASRASGQGKVQLFEATAQGKKLIQTAYPAWQRAQEQVRELLGGEAAEALAEAGSRQLQAALER